MVTFLEIPGIPAGPRLAGPGHRPQLVRVGADRPGRAAVIEADEPLRPPMGSVKSNGD